MSEWGGVACWPEDGSNIPTYRCAGCGEINYDMTSDQSRVWCDACENRNEIEVRLSDIVCGERN